MSPCFHPIRAFYPIKADSDGKRYLKFGKNRYKLGQISQHTLWINHEDLNYLDSKTEDIYDSEFPYPIYYDFNGDESGLNIKVPCGKCIGCRLDYSRSWALRSSNEAMMYDNYKNCAFLTLTFNDDMLLRRENPYSINKVAFRSWMKRLRKAVKAHYNTEFRFMGCAEYGARHLRPHYHLVVYGFNFPDKYIYKYRKIHGKEVIYYRSPFLEKIWSPAHSSESFGFSVIGDVNFESSAYVARYVTKKLFGKVAQFVYKDKEPEFLLTSRMPGLGYRFFELYYKNFIDRGYMYTPNGFKAPIPRYYVNKCKEINPELYNKYWIENFNSLCDNLIVKDSNCTLERLKIREELKKQNLNILLREYEFSKDTSF